MTLNFNLTNINISKGFLTPATGRDLASWLISSTYLHEAFTPVAPQSIRTQSSCQYLFMLLGSTSVKAVHRTLMKLSPGRGHPEMFRGVLKRARPKEA